MFTRVTRYGVLIRKRLWLCVYRRFRFFHVFVPGLPIHVWSIGFLLVLWRCWK